MARGKVLLLISIGFLFGLLLGSYSTYLSSQKREVLRRMPLWKSQDVRLLRVGTRLADRTFQILAAAPSGSGAPPVTPSDYQELASRGLAFPVPGAGAKDIQDTFNEARGDHRHEATDIMAPRGATVVAVEDGVIKKLFTSRWGGLTIYQFDPSGNYCYYYAHLDRYREGIKEGLAVRRGDQIAYVGSTGDAATPHLHFTIFKLGPEKNWWQGTAINAYPFLTAALNRK